jgi:DNA-binding CsgD family transcriptional regulator
METSIMLAEELEIGGVIPQQYAYLSHIAFQRGDPEKAQAHLNAAEQVMTAEGVHFGIQVMLWVRAVIVEAAGNTKDAFELLSSAWSMLGNGYSSQYQTLGPDMVRIALAVGDRSQAQLAVEGVELAASNSGLASSRGIALRCRGLLEGDPSLLEAGVASLRQSPRRLELAFACEDAGVALWRVGRNAQAVSLLEEARLEYYRVGARRPIARTTAALRALGVRRREPSLGRRPSVGWAALTPTELSVINLVKDGLTSREIGAQLSISRRTVETHLAHIFSKLGISSRVQLAIAYAREHETEKPAAIPSSRIRS